MNLVVCPCVMYCIFFFSPLHEPISYIRIQFFLSVSFRLCRKSKFACVSFDGIVVKASEWTTQHNAIYYWLLLLTLPLLLFPLFNIVVSRVCSLLRHADLNLFSAMVQVGRQRLKLKYGKPSETSDIGQTELRQSWCHSTVVCLTVSQSDVGGVTVL